MDTIILTKEVKSNIASTNQLIYNVVCCKDDIDEIIHKNILQSHILSASKSIFIIEMLNFMCASNR